MGELFFSSEKKHVACYRYSSAEREDINVVVQRLFIQLFGCTERGIVQIQPAHMLWSVCGPLKSQQGWVRCWLVDNLAQQGKRTAKKFIAKRKKCNQKKLAKVESFHSF